MALTSFTRGARAIGVASLLAAVALPAVVLLLGAPLALLVRTLHEGLSWLTRAGGMTSPFIEASIAFASAVSGLALFALSARVLLRFYSADRIRPQRSSR